MSPTERHEFLRVERTARLATSSTAGPHVTPVWFVWHDDAIWVTSLRDAQRWRDVEREPRVALVVDAGERYDELRGVEITGPARPVGEVPRVGSDVAELRGPEQAFARKYTGTDTMTHDGRHAWLRIEPERVISWDFRKMRRESAPSS
jgi:hypothetical protein